MDYLSFTSDYNQDRNNYMKDPKGPFGQNISQSTLRNELFSYNAVPIVEKIDEILKVDLTLKDPVVGNVLTTDTAQGTVVYVNKVGTKTLIYLKDVQGIFSSSDSINFGNLEIGAYDRVITEDYNQLGGWWRVDFPTAVSTDLYSEFSGTIEAESPTVAAVDPRDFLWVSITSFPKLSLGWTLVIASNTIPLPCE